MKKEIHPKDYRFVVFKDISTGYSFLSKSTSTLCIPSTDFKPFSTFDPHPAAQCIPEIDIVQLLWVKPKKTNIKKEKVNNNFFIIVYFKINK